MKHRIVEKDGFTLAGCRTTVPLQYEGVNPHIADFIAGLPEDLHEHIKALSDQDPAGLLSATYVHDPARGEGTDVDYLHAVATHGPVPEDLEVLSVPAATWAVFEATGPFPEAVQQLWADTAAVWFPSNPYRAVHGPELLRTELNEDRTAGTCELWIMVEPASSTPR